MHVFLTEQLHPPIPRKGEEESLLICAAQEITAVQLDSCDLCDSPITTPTGEADRGRRGEPALLGRWELIIGLIHNL